MESSGPPLCIGILGCASHNDPAAQRALDFAISRRLSPFRGDFLYLVPAESGPSLFATQYARSHGISVVPAPSAAAVRADADIVIACRCLIDADAAARARC